LKNELKIDQNAADVPEKRNPVPEPEDVQVSTSQSAHDGPANGPAGVSAKSKTDLKLQKQQRFKNRRCTGEVAGAKADYL
jgi:hypothetical protein